MLLRYRYDDVFYDQQEDGVNDQQTNQQVNISDSRTDTIDFSLVSGRQFSVLRWELDYFYQRQQQDNQGNIDATDNGDDRRENVTGQLSYRLNRQWALLAEAGYENNQVTDFEDSRNGSYWGLGAIWSPSRFLELQGLYGSDVNEAALRWNPSLRTNLQISRRDQSVGAVSYTHLTLPTSDLV